MTIGERLEEARKRKGVSIREAAEATKIRGDYLLAMEANRIEEIALPQIYVRGFLKNYARFVKADPDNILTDYDAYLARRASTGNGSAKESLGRMELPDDEEIADEGRTPSGSSDSANTAKRPPLVASSANLAGDRPPPADSGDNALYIKIAVISGSVGIVVLLLVLLISVLRSPDTPAEGTLATNESAVEAETAPSRHLILRATGDVTVIVEEVANRARLYQGSLNAGDAVSIEREGPVSIRFSDGEALTIERNGREVSVGASGPGRTTIQ